MDNHGKIKIIRQHFPVFDQLNLVEELADNCMLLQLQANAEILHENIYINTIPLVIEGTVKVSRIDNNGREVFLYYIKEGQSCAMTLTSFLRQEKSKVRAKTMEPSKLLTIPSNIVYNLNKKYPSWQQFVINTFSQRFEEMIQTIEGVVFSNMQERIINHLKKRAENQQSNAIIISHQEIATDLATSREVISRLLKQIEKEGLIRLSRNKIELEEPLLKNKNASM
jgi:CRP/FNR family transcriptional regulator